MDIGLDTESGVVVIDAGSGGLGISALQPGDIILEVNGTKITSVSQLESVLKAGKHKWKIVGKRGDNVITLNVES